MRGLTTVKKLDNAATGLVRVKGGAGSGNWGHGGLPGVWGGSSSHGGGAAFAPNTVSDNIIYTEDNNASAVLDDGLPEGLGWQSTVGTVAQGIKDQIITQLSEESGVPYDVVNEIVGQWVVSSNDNNADSLALQENATKALGLELSNWQQKKVDTILHEYDKKYARYEKLVQHIQNKYGNDLIDKLVHAKDVGDTVEFNRILHENPELQELHFTGKGGASVLRPWNMLEGIAGNWTKGQYLQRAHGGEYLREIEARQQSSGPQQNVIRAMYSQTQARIAETTDLKPDDTVRLYRGVGLPSKQAGNWNVGDVIDYSGNAIESWSVNPAVARTFASRSLKPGVVGIVLEMNVPVRNVVSTARTGFGCLLEGEFVIAGNIPGSQAAVAISDTLPD